MKIAAVSDDGQTISPHFGRAAQYVVVTVEKGQIVARELRSKLGHNHFSGKEENHAAEGHGHGMDPASQSRHADMLTAVSDCEVLLARGMGAGAYLSVQQAGITPILTDVPSIDDAIREYLKGTLADHVERLH